MGTGAGQSPRAASTLECSPELQSVKLPGSCLENGGLEDQRGEEYIVVGTGLEECSWRGVSLQGLFGREYHTSAGLSQRHFTGSFSLAQIPRTADSRECGCRLFLRLPANVLVGWAREKELSVSMWVMELGSSTLSPALSDMGAVIPGPHHLRE